ncbi:RsmF rRNA methyltransferase first C-terminal domain-containing protein [Niabella aquatica]
MQLPSALVDSLQGLKDFNEGAFRQVHAGSEKVTSIRIHPQKRAAVAEASFFGGERSAAVPWSAYGYYLSERPSFTFDPLFHAGCYYVQEASSMFIEQALKQTADLSGSLKVLDLCAAPGGKSTHIQSLLSKDSLLVSNEVIRQRAHILKDNMVKWGSGNVVVTNNDPKDFAKLRGYFDVVVVDAPCSGSGLFRRDAEAINEWSENNVMLCSQRQQRILADVMPALKKNGVLIYSTCSYSKQEDEDILDWLTDEFQISNIQFQIDSNWHITEVETRLQNYGYRFWPHLVKGEGFFMAAFRKNEEAIHKNKSRPVTKPAAKPLKVLVEKWATIDGYELMSVNNKVYGWPGLLFSDFDLLLQNLRIIYSGVLLGEMAHQKFIPDHALAMSPLVNKDWSREEVDITKAIAYLQRNNIELTNAGTGWKLITYQNQVLGWVNVLPNRVNNYYPRELRILKDRL